MGLMRSILTVLAAVLALGFPFLLGYGLALHETMPMIYGGGSLLLGAVMFFLLSRSSGEERHTAH